MINFILLRTLPYEIKLLIYVAVKNYHNRKIKYGFNNIVNTIDGLNNTVKILINKNFNIVNTIDGLNNPLKILINKMEDDDRPFLFFR